MRHAVRRSLAVLTVVTVALGVSALRSPAALAAATCTNTVTTNYTIQLCITAPAAGATLTGPTTVSATQTVLSGNVAVGAVTFTLNGQALLTAYSTVNTPPYTFTWHTAHWVDGAYTLGVYARMTDGTTTSSNPTTESVILANGVTTAPTNGNSPTITTGTVPPAGQPEIVGAVGSGADGTTGSNNVASEVRGWSPNLFLYLGDVYEMGTYEEFNNWYDPAWGPMRSVTNPVPGDQEVYYGVQGYNWYWNNEPAYYSFDAAGWHFIALTTCAYSSNSYPPSGLCTGSSAEVTWLNNELATHPGACTIAYWHEPRWALDGSGGSVAEQPLWGPLANSHATAVVNADRHNYQRWTAMDANGNASATGMAEFVVGTGNHNWEPISGSDPRVMRTITNTPGALKLSLTATTAGFQFIGLDGTVGDSGSLPCQGNGTLAGVVTDGGSGAPIAGASISYSGTGPSGAVTGSTTTDATGHYSVAGIAVSSYSVSAQAGGYQSQTATAVVGGGSTATQNFALTAQTSRLTGTVTDATTSQPIAGATVSAGAASAATNSSGVYSISGLAPGTYTATATATGYTSQSASVTVTAGSTTTQNFALTSTTGTISGTLTDALTAAPIAGATVSYSGGSSTTNANGQYSLAGVPPGTYSLTASATGYASQTASVTASAGAATTQNFILSPNPGTISGTVTDAGSTAPIAGATVSYSGGSATTDGSGNYTLAGVAEGSYTLTASASGYQSQSRTVTVGPGATATQNFALTLPYGAITGTVTDAATGSAIGGATVSYSGGSATTNSSGQYTLANVPPGTYSISAGASGYTGQSRSVAVAAGATASASFALWRAPFFSDGFESGNLSSWSGGSGLSVQTTAVHSGTYAAEGSTLNGTTYALKQLGSGYQDLYYRSYFDIKSQTTGFTLMADQTASGGGIMRLYVNGSGQLVLWNDVTQLTTTGPTVSLGTWHSAELHVNISGLVVTTEVWLDGTSIPAFSTSSATLGLMPVGQVQLGSQSMLQIYDVVFDDVAVSTSRTGP